MIGNKPWCCSTFVPWCCSTFVQLQLHRRREGYKWSSFVGRSPTFAIYATPVSDLFDLLCSPVFPKSTMTMTGQTTALLLLFCLSSSTSALRSGTTRLFSVNQLQSEEMVLPMSPRILVTGAWYPTTQLENPAKATTMSITRPAGRAKGRSVDVRDSPSHPYSRLQFY